jgi:hypothetical protein
MSKMGNVILDIQELANMGIPNDAIAKQTKTSIDFVDQVVQDMFEWDSPEFIEGDDEYV